MNQDKRERGIARGTTRWHAARLKPQVKNRGTKNVGKQKKKAPMM